MAKQTALDRKIAALDTEIARLHGIRDYLTQDSPSEPAAEKPKRTRKKRGMPATTETAKEGIF